MENTGAFCDARTVLESTIEQVLATAINATLKSRDSFLATLQNNIATELSMKNEKQKAQMENVGRDDQRKRNADMSIFLWKQPTVIKEYDEKLVQRLIDKVTVYEDRFEMVFRSGVAVEVDGTA